CSALRAALPSFPTRRSSDLCRAGHVQRELQVLLELRLNQLFVVGEHEAAAVASFGELRRPGKHVPSAVRPVGELAIGDVQVGTRDRKSTRLNSSHVKNSYAV